MTAFMREIVSVAFSGLYGLVEGLLEGFGGGGFEGGLPVDGYFAEGFGDEEAVPGVECPGALRVQVEAGCGAVGAGGDGGCSGLDEVDGASWAVGGDGGFVAFDAGSGDGEEAGGASAG